MENIITIEPKITEREIKIYEEIKNKDCKELKNFYYNCMKNNNNFEYCFPYYNLLIYCSTKLT
tara:strand:- start:1 stop:189 length:189 start_codon:yes stop_codon:yes gene_type:complete